MKRGQDTHAEARVDYGSRTCVAIRNGPLVTWVELDTDGLSAQTAPAKMFDERFKELLPDVKQAFAFFKDYAVNHYGCDKDVLELLEKVVTLTEKEKTMAKAKSKKVNGTAEGKGRGVKTRGPSAAGMFKELIMAGKLSDDAIFKCVQDKFGLADNKRGYVAWYRNALKNSGQKPPAAKD